MNRLLLLLRMLFVAAVAIGAMAQEEATPIVRPAFDRQALAVTSPFQLAPSGTPPPICKPCLFYGGDIDPNDPNADGFPDGNTLLTGESETFGAITVPAGREVRVEGLLFNVLADPNNFDPMTATWEIRSGVSEGNGGKQVAYGSGNANIAPTGRIVFGYPEMTVAVAVILPVMLSAGTYWFNVSPQCTNTGDPICSTAQYFASNTTHETNNVRGGMQPLHDMYLYALYGDIDYFNLCDVNNSHQCAALSFGVIGR